MSYVDAILMVDHKTIAVTGIFVLAFVVWMDIKGYSDE